MNFDKIAGDSASCHPELCEGSASQSTRVPAPQMLRCAQHDRFDLPSFFVKVHNRVRLAPLDDDEDAINRVHELQSEGFLCTYF